MATKSVELNRLDLTDSRRTLVLVWQNPVSHRFVKVGQLDALPAGRVAFQYLPTAWDDPDFVPLLEYPDRHTAYVSDEVPAFFANRILSTDRPNYDEYLGWLGIANLGPEDVPFEVLARTGGGRATDTFHVVDLPLNLDHSFESRFFISGIRYSPDAEAVVGVLLSGASLRLDLEETNPVNPKAVLIDTADGRKIGYVPDWLCADVYQRITSDWSVSAVAERVNPDAPARVKVLCRITAERK